MHRHGTPSVAGAVFLFLLVTVCSAPSAASEFTREFSFDSSALHLSNMIGAIEVKAGTTDAFKVTVTVAGEDAAEGLLDFVIAEGSKGGLAIKFPLDDHSKYVYPALKSGSKTTISFHDTEEEGGSWLKKVFSGMNGKKVTVKGDGNGLEVWADVVIETPQGSTLEVKLGVGEIAATGLAADLNLDTNSGPIRLASVTGDVLADTGSGRVEVTGIQGDINIDTGSGRVDVVDCEGQDIKVDTGSGRVRGEGLTCAFLNIDTGSGSVQALRIKAEGARIDTGSGSVELQLDRMGEGDFEIDTGSGSIELVIPAGAAARISADTGSGSVKNKIEDAVVQSQERDEIEMTVGTGGGRVKLDAGSGSITIRQK